MSDSLTRDLDENIQTIFTLFGNCSDLSVRRLEAKGEIQFAILFLNSIVEKEIIDEFVIKDMLSYVERYSETKKFDTENLEMAKGKVSTTQLSTLHTIEEVIESLVKGMSIILVNGHELVLAAGTEGNQRRTVSEPGSETVVRGSREAFNESLQINLGLIRNRLRTHKLRIETLTIGNLTNTPVSILYIEDVAKPTIVDEVRNRLRRIQIDGVMESLYLEEMIEDPHTYTPFPTVFNTERPDRIVAGMLEGRIAILTEGTPIGLLVPASISLFLYSNEDYYQRFDISSFLKLLRTFTFLLSFIMPGFYVFLLTYHQEMIPTPLLIALTGQREGVPFGIAIEVALMEITFEILREAGIRLPKTIGAAVSIVGGLVLGQASVEAGLIGPGTVITVSLTAIASFCTPSYNFAIAARLIRFALLLLSAILGAFGMMFGIIFLVIHMCSLRSFGIPYLTPMVPYHSSGWKDLFIRMPWWKMQMRPDEIAGKNANRMPKLNKWGK